ncbi:SMI1/KNR4 family protein [Streptomyces sp. NPDC126514]|uniref:SMI1/KNR4 family protein n=1 Tax=Streptomyces sp. NPDC126514 TaxID=3155210 RepID=UPI00332D325B
MPAIVTLACCLITNDTQDTALTSKPLITRWTSWLMPSFGLMSDRSLSPAWLASWTDRVSVALTAMTVEFEHRHGFPPGANEVRPADHDDQAAARTLAQVVPTTADLVTFYDSIGEVTWADVGNGYFLDPARNVVQRLQEYGVVDAGAERAHGLVIGSNGGGLAYVAGPDGAVYRTRTASLDEPEVDKAADHLRQFLEPLEHSLTRFIVDGDPGCL